MRLFLSIRGKGGFYQRHTKTNKARRRPVSRNAAPLSSPSRLLSLSLSSLSLARRKAQQPTRALASYVLFAASVGITKCIPEGCRAAQFISSYEKSANAKQKTRAQTLSLRRPRAPERPTPRALAMPKSLECRRRPLRAFRGSQKRWWWWWWWCACLFLSS